MSVMQGFAADWRSSDEAGLDSPAIAAFVRGQCACLRRGLKRAEDAAAVEVVLRRHESWHETWLSLISVVQRSCPVAGAEVAGLYAFQGRVAGCLERGPDPLLDPAVRAGVRELLADHLSALTERTVAAVTVTRSAVPAASETSGSDPAAAHQPALAGEHA